MSAPIPEDEIRRLDALDRYQVLDTLPEPSYDDVTRLASQICETPISLVSLVDRERQWFKSRHGLTAEQTPRQAAFCAHAILEKDLLVVPDTLEDERFAENPLVTGEPRIRFYAGAPLVTSEGFALGTLCVIDRVGRSLSAAQAEALRALSRQVMALLELRRAVSALETSRTRLMALQRQLQQTNARLEDESVRDDVTGHFNTRFLHRALDDQFERSNRARMGVAIVFFDMDGFKSVVDGYGHLVGSRVLGEVARVVAPCLGPEDSLVRYGGDEFVAILRGQRSGQALVKAENMREAIRSHVFQREHGLSIQVTASFGVASYPEDAGDKEALLGAADRGLFESKARGRDRVSVHPRHRG